MKSIEVTGKTVKDAFNKGLLELGCTSADVEMQVLEMGSPGLFGMFGKPAKVRLTVKSEDPELDIEMPTLSLDTPSARKPRTEKRKEQPGFDFERATLMTKKYSLNQNNANTFSKIYDYSSTGEGEGVWYCIVDRAEGGRCLFLLEPNEKMLAAMKEYTPKNSWQE